MKKWIDFVGICGYHLWQRVNQNVTIIDYENKSIVFTRFFSGKNTRKNFFDKNKNVSTKRFEISEKQCDKCFVIQIYTLKELDKLRKIKAQPLSEAAFRPYGSYASITDPKGSNLGGFYNDQVCMPVNGNWPLGLSPLIQNKPEKMIVTKAEYHNTTGESMVMMDDDMVLHVAPASNKPVPELTQAFIVPKGTVVYLKTGVWHCGAFPINKDEAHVLIMLPERIYMTDCELVEYDESQYMEIEL